MKHANSVLDVVGHTPLVNLNRVTDAVQVTVLVKAEYLNPRGVGAQSVREPERVSSTRCSPSRTPNRAQ